MTTGLAAAVPALVLAPLGRDAVVAAGLLGEAGIASRSFIDLESLCAAISDEVALLVVAEEATRGADLQHLTARLAAQPAWSDLPCIVLTHRGGGPERNPATARLADALGNVTFVERPFRPSTFTSVARTAFKGRLRQFEARARLVELRESEERLRIALSAGRLGTWELDASTSVLACSPTCKAHFGRGPDAPFGYADLVASLHPEDLPHLREELERNGMGNSDHAVECRVTWPDGSVHWLEMRARSVAEGGRTRLVGVSREVTDRKAFEANLRQLNGSLEERVAERTAELSRAHETVLEESRQREQAEEQLRQAQKMEVIGQLTGGIAHDFNNLLMAVLGNLDLLSRHLHDDPKASRLLDGALQGAKRGAALTQRLLAFARRQELQIEPVDMLALVRGMAPLLDKSVGPGVEIRIDAPDGLPMALADENQAELALLNLVVNARDAMPDGGVIRIGLGLGDGGERPETLTEGSYVVLWVADTGAGMDRETMGRAIEPFFSTKGVGKGTGLGLSMIHGLAQQLDGALRLESEVGAGTRAEIWLPATRRRREETTAEIALPARESGGSRAAVVLFVDDDALIAMATVDMLEDLGHEVIEVNSGAEALTVLESNPVIDLMITDYSMPKMTGAQLAAQARLLRPDLPILLATGYAELPEGAEMDLPRLAKPYVQDQLAAEIAKLVP